MAVSATIPNVHDIAQWLRVPAAGLLVFGEDMRPVRLVTHVRGYAQTSNDYLFERRLNDYLPGIVAEFSKGKPTLIFCRRVHPWVHTGLRTRCCMHASAVSCSVLDHCATWCAAALHVLLVS